jgi:drug/metabolite transporter (DMT)-like permease
MRVLAAYVAVIALWGTTPLAIKWSGEGPGFLFGVISRMAIGTACVLPLLGLFRIGLPLHRKALLSYLAGAVQIFGAMLVVYWASQYIPSGWISVVFGLSPLMTALMAAIWLGERSLTYSSLLSYGFGLAGLAVMFGSALEFGPLAALGISGVLVSAILQAVSAIWIKRIDAKLPALAQLGGGLLLAMPAYLITWVATDGQWPRNLSDANLLSILYLGVVATSLGFALYFYLLTHLTATRVALITLVSPVLALLVGNRINDEPVSERVVIGTGLILAALLLHEWRGLVRRRPTPVAAPGVPEPMAANRRRKDRKRPRRGIRPSPATTANPRMPPQAPLSVTTTKAEP